MFIKRDVLRDFGIISRRHPEEAQAFAKRSPADEDLCTLLAALSSRRRPGDCRHYAIGETGAVEIESQPTA
jgi:hypothetical protein